MLIERLKQACLDDRLRAVDLALAEWGLRHGASQPVALGLALASRSVSEGHACLFLDEDFAPAIPGEQPLCDSAAFREALDASELVGSTEQSRPLILDNNRLYLHRYWQYECRLAERLKALTATTPAEVDTGILERDGGLFDYRWIAEGETHWQAVAAATALRHRFSVISGGPGTGKTYTVLRLMQLLITDAQAHDRPAPTIALAAPTGKAAARMMDSTRAGLAQLPDGETLAAFLPESASTLHRLLGLRGDTTRPRHDRDNPLTADVVIVDEASMVDLPMMAKLADAVPRSGRLILLGDRYQLASVESGAVLAELCDAAGVNAFSPAQSKNLSALLRSDAPATPETPPPLADHVVTLQTSHRFTADSAIGRLASAVNAGDADGALGIIREGKTEIQAQLGDALRLDPLIDTLSDAYAELMQQHDPVEALERLSETRLLTATRVGPNGSEGLNQAIHERLCKRFGLDPEQRWYHGRPVIIQHNDYRIGLFNGDTGICMKDEHGHLRVWFQTSGNPRALLPTALPRHDSVYAMTVHKSQGSEFDRVHLLLPDRDMPVLTRELIYTGITRARSALTLYGNETALRAAIGRSTRRHSGLAKRLESVT